LQLHRTAQRGQGKRHVIEQRALRRLAARGLLLGLDPLPRPARLECVSEARIREHLGVSANHLCSDGVNDVAEAEASLLLCHARVIDDLQQEIAELVLKPIEIAARDRVGHLIAFLDGVGRNRREGLIAIPRAAGCRVPQPRHHAQKIVNAERLGRRVGHYRGQARRAGQPAARRKLIASPRG